MAHDEDSTAASSSFNSTQLAPDRPWRFATLSPDNDVARLSFNAVLKQVDADAHDVYHANFIALRDEVSSQRQSQGHGEAVHLFECSFGQVPRGPQGAWRLGKGSARAFGKETRGVEILLCPSKDPDLSQHIAPVHALIYVHPRSGAWLLRSTTSQHQITYQGGDTHGDVVLGPGDTAVLHMALNRLRIGPLVYSFEFDVEDQSHYVTLRNGYIESIIQSPVLPHPQLDPLPKQVHHRMRRVIIHRSISTGAFGTVRSAVDARTGDPLAVKTVLCKNRRQRASVEAEFGIVQSIGPVCSYCAFPFPRTVTRELICGFL